MASRTSRRWFVGITVVLLLIVGATGFVLFNLTHHIDPVVLPSQTAGQSPALTVGVATGQDLRQTAPLAASAAAPSADSTASQPVSNKVSQTASLQASPTGVTNSGGAAANSVGSLVGSALSLAGTLDGCTPDGAYLSCLYGLHPAGCTAVGQSDMLHVLFSCD